MANKTKKLILKFAMAVEVPEQEVGGPGEGVGPWVQGFLENQVSDLTGLWPGAQPADFNELVFMEAEPND